jgi:integrase
MRHSTKGKQSRKAANSFPLFKHATGRWAKKIKGRFHYFGKVADDPTGQKAVDLFLEQKPYLLAGRKPPTADSDQLSVSRLCNLFLENRERRAKSGEITQGTFEDYKPICKIITDHFGRHTAVEFLTPSDFAELRDKFAEGNSIKTLEGYVARARAVFNFGQKNGYFDRPLSKIWGVEFDKPGSLALQKERNKITRLFDPAEIRVLIENAGVPLKAMVFLGINCAMGPTDIARLEFKHVDLENGWLEMERSKTGKPRRIPLWPETVQAIREAISKRVAPKSDDNRDLVFITAHGNSWASKGALSKEFVKLTRSTKITGKGKTFYTLRHCFQTIGDEGRDFVAVSSIMGHAANSISDHYREKIGDDRLRDVSDHVRQWLFGEGVSQ